MLVPGRGKPCRIAPQNTRQPEKEEKMALRDREAGVLDAGIERILVNVTPTSNWIGVVEQSVQMAKKLGARLYVIDVIHDPFGLKGWNLPNLPLHNEYRRIVQRVRDRLRILVDNEKRRGFLIESVVREGDPIEQITRVIEEFKIDLLVIPTHEEDRLEHFLSGSTTDKLVRKMPCSILLLKQSPEDEELIP
jgi:nucleotide-binding universal stress UspA family protein